MGREISGIHHITAIAGDPQANLDFYAGFLGLRMVKLTVNYDDPGTYHIYYGDRRGHPDFAPQQGDIIIKEHWGQSGFANTDLDSG